MTLAEFLNNARSLCRQIIYSQIISRSLEYELIKAVEEEDGYLFENANELAALIQRIIEAIHLSLDVEYDQKIRDLVNQKSMPLADREKELRRIAQRVNETIQISATLTPLLKFVDGAMYEGNPRVLISQVDRLCRNLNIKARVIVRPRWQYNYTYYPISHNLWAISKLANQSDSRLNISLSRLLTEAPFFFSLAFPPTTKPNLLQMAIWGHELGHFTDNFEGMRLHKDDTSLDEICFLSRELIKEIKPNIPPKVIKKIISDAGYSNDVEIAEVLEKVNEPICRLVSEWASELFADIYSVHLFGPAAILALVEFVQPLEEKASLKREAYPPLDVRLRVMLQVYDKWLSRESGGTRDQVQDVLTAFEAEFDKIRNTDPHSLQSELYDDRESLVSDKLINVVYPYMISYLDTVIDEFSKRIEAIIAENPDCFMKPGDLLHIQGGMKDLALGMPPDLVGTAYDPDSAGIRKRLLALVINTGWLYWLKILQTSFQNKSGNTEYALLHNDLEILNNLLLFSVEENETEQWFMERGRFTELDPVPREEADRNFLNGISKNKRTHVRYSGILCKKDILQEISSGKLTIRPLLSPSTQIHESSIDLRLGNNFTYMKRSTLTKLDPVEIYKDTGFWDRQQTTYFIPFGTPFVLHPGQFVITSSLEYLHLPSYCLGWIACRRWWTKLGLFQVNPQDLPPSFLGKVSFELTNVGNAPIYLYPGARISQFYLLSINSHIHVPKDQPNAIPT